MRRRTPAPAANLLSARSASFAALCYNRRFPSRRKTSRRSRSLPAYRACSARNLCRLAATKSLPERSSPRHRRSSWRSRARLPARAPTQDRSAPEGSKSARGNRRWYTRRASRAPCTHSAANRRGSARRLAPASFRSKRAGSAACRPGPEFAGYYARACLPTTHHRPSRSRRRQTSRPFSNTPIRPGTAPFRDKPAQQAQTFPASFLFPPQGSSPQPARSLPSKAPALQQDLPQRIFSNALYHTSVSAVKAPRKMGSPVSRSTIMYTKGRFKRTLCG